MLRGSIPILPASISPYCVGELLEDGKNCLLVRPNDWREVVKKAIHMPREQLIRFRRNIAASADEYSDSTTCRRIAIALGFTQ